MNVLELQELAKWYENYRPNLIKKFNSLHSVLTNNASQPTQSPIVESLDGLIIFLKGMDTSLLSVQQLAILEELEVDDLVGLRGSLFVTNLAVTSTYDPATTRDAFGEAIAKLNAASKKLNAYASAVSDLGMDESSLLPEDGRYIIRVGFKNDASIANLVDWKVSAANWHLIIRGVAMAAGEAPEATSIIGATKGSIIVVLAASAPVTKLMAVISKHLTGIAKDFISVGVEIENLKQKKLLTASIKAELEAQRTKRKADGIAKLESELSKGTAPPKKAEIAVELKKSIEKLLDFEEKGGDLDFVTPPEQNIYEEGNVEGPPDGLSAELESVRQSILEYQQEREAVKMLTHDDNS